MFDADILVPGEAAGTVFRLDAPLSFWGGLDPATGTIIDERHPQRGENMSGRILAMARGRGSSSSTGVLAEAIRLGTAPVAIIMSEPDVIVTLGAMVAGELYGTSCPVVVVDPERFATLRTGLEIEIIDEGATVHMMGNEEADHLAPGNS
jgi:predicted aconitase with swiveling domain